MSASGTPGSGRRPRRIVLLAGAADRAAEAVLRDYATGDLRAAGRLVAEKTNDKVLTRIGLSRMASGDDLSGPKIEGSSSTIPV